ncbi:taxadiene 5-alpha hydroxylase-like isoform X2 [Carica papaya]|uniref:taxadiene 5-alpha hydroxylase-like isoform X2 n=1 Tax=Carica papaya TaxID=3649 RepID=UPI000B8C818D|nr:taxadiene 5-alpha hydroxylase-like isoform X2 [Carica papaya]
MYISIYGQDQVVRTMEVVSETSSIWKVSGGGGRRLKLPPGSFGLPLIGETMSFVKAHKESKIGEWVDDHVAKHGSSIFKTVLMGSKTVVITGQAGNRFILSGSDNGIAANQPASVRSVLGKHSIFELAGGRHKLVRGGMTRFLGPESIQRYVGQMDSLVNQQLSQELNGKISVKMVELMKKITLRVTCSLLFGLDEDKEKDELSMDFTTLLRGVWSFPINFPGTTCWKSMKARRRIVNKLSKLAARRRIDLEEGRLNCEADVISCLVSLRDENGHPLLEEEIVDNLLSLMSASHDTITVLLSLFIRHLAIDSTAYNKVLKEQMEVAQAVEANNGEKLGMREIQMMKYTWSVAQELMRLTPPVFGGFRTTWRDTSFGGYDIPKGWKVLWVASGTHMDENLFQDPKKFDSSRFEGSVKSVPPYTYVAFGAGMRFCPGADFARIEVLLVIHHLIKNYKWTQLIRDEPIIQDPLPYPAMGLPVKLCPINTL